jgi:hypothetical protein
MIFINSFSIGFLKKFSDFESLLYTIPLPTGFWKKVLN